MANSMANSMTNPIVGDIHKATTWSIVLSVLMIAAGVLAIFSPAIAGVAVTVFFGWLLIFSGILHLAYACRRAAPAPSSGRFCSGFSTAGSASTCSHSQAPAWRR